MQARSWTPGLEGAYFAYGQPLAAIGIVYSFSGLLSEPLEGAPQRHEPAPPPALGEGVDFDKIDVERLLDERVFDG